jgi:hypothetical protein
VKVDFEKKKLGDFFVELSIFPFSSFPKPKTFLSLSRLRASLARFERKSKIKKQSLRRSRSFFARSSQPSIERSFASVDLIHLFARGEKIDRAREKGGGGCFFCVCAREKRKLEASHQILFLSLIFLAK